MKKRLTRTAIVATLTAALVTPALGSAAYADHWNRGNAYWKHNDWHAKKRIVRKWRHHHHEPRYVVRQYAYRPHRHGTRDDALLGSFLGAAFGALLGTSLGRSMDNNDFYQVNQALETSPTGSTIVWQNTNTGGAYRVTPTRTYQVAQNAYCREFVTWGMIGGYEEKMYGTACRQPDGSWTTVK